MAREGADRVRARRPVDGRRACGSSVRPIPVGRGGTISFALDGVHPHDVGQILDDARRCRYAWDTTAPGRSAPRFGVAAMTRASFYLYTTTDEIDALVRGLEQVRKVFGLMQFDAALPGDHPGPLQAAARPWPARAVRRSRRTTSTRPAATRSTSGCTLDGDDVDDVSYDGMGCSISQAVGERAVRLGERPDA